MSLFGADGQQRPRPCAFQRDRSILRNRSQLSLNGVFDREIRVIWGTGPFASKLLLNRYRIERGRKIEKNWENALATILLIGNKGKRRVVPWILLGKLLNCAIFGSKEKRNCTRNSNSNSNLNRTIASDNNCNNRVTHIVRIYFH